MSQATRDAIRPSSVDSKTRWAFRALSPVTVHTSIVRLGDVALPLDPDMAGWQRLSRSVIGLVPLGGEAMTIDRERLGQAITSAEATARTIEWIGAEQIVVQFRKSHEPSNDSPVIQTSGFSTPSMGQQNDRHSALIPNVDANLPQADPVLIKRLIYWIELAIGRLYPNVNESFAVSIDPKQNSLRILQHASGVDHVELSNEAVDDGNYRVSVTGRSKHGPIQANIEIVLQAHPRAIVSRASYRRGHRFQSQDLTTRPVPEEQWNDRFVTSPDELIGMEAKGTIRENVPITRELIGRPILIRRGDRVEVRVIGGGVDVTTNGRAMEEGSESDLIEVETLEPRKKLIARIAGPGLVEILTRPPRVRE